MSPVKMTLYDGDLFPKTSWPFEYVARLTEVMLLGIEVPRAGSEIDYPGANMRITDLSQTNGYLRRGYRHVIVNRKHRWRPAGTQFSLWRLDLFCSNRGETLGGAGARSM